MPTHQDKGECPVTLHKQPVALYVPLETHTEGLGAWWYWQGQRLVKANFRPSRQQVAAHQSQRFSPAGLPQVLVACGRKGAFKKKKGCPPIYNGEKEWPLTFQGLYRSEGMAVSCSPAGRHGVVNTSDTEHPERFIFLSNILSPRGSGKGKNLNWTRHFTGVSPS